MSCPVMKRSSSYRPGLIWIGFSQSRHRACPLRPPRPPLWTTDLQLLAVLLHLAQLLRGLPLQSVELVLQPAAVHAFLLHAAAQRGQLHRCGAQVKGQWQRRVMMSVCRVCVCGGREGEGVCHPQECLLREMFRSFSVSFCFSGTSCESFLCQSYRKHTHTNTHTGMFARRQFLHIITVFIFF